MRKFQGGAHAPSCAPLRTPMTIIIIHLFFNAPQYTIMIHHGLKH